jgi:hypothetical protein
VKEIRVSYERKAEMRGGVMSKGSIVEAVDPLR